MNKSKENLDSNKKILSLFYYSKYSFNKLFEFNELFEYSKTIYPKKQIKFLLLLIQQKYHISLDYLDIANKLIEFCNHLTNKIDLTYQQIKNNQSQKLFAFEALKFKYSYALFLLRAQKVSNAKEYLQKTHVNNILKLLEL